MRLKFIWSTLFLTNVFILNGIIQGDNQSNNSLKILQPNGGEIWQKGTLQTIAWEGSLSGQIGIELYKGSVLKKNIGIVDSSAGVQIWKVSPDLDTGNDYRIKIIRGSLSDLSDGYFSIQDSPSSEKNPGREPPEDKGKDAEDKDKDGKKAPDKSIATLRGNWIGGGAGEEVRFRNRNLTLTVKHATKFYLYINENDEIEGEGTIEYDLDRNTEGLDQLVAEIRGMISSFVAGIPSLKMANGPVRDFAKNRLNSGLQYDAPHLKYGPEIRHIKIRGRVEKPKLKDYQGANIYLELSGDFTLPDGKTDSQLIAAWEVNKEKEQKPFPCWSPFLKGPGILRKGPGEYWVMEFQEKGKQRNNVKIWHEYGYYWMARQIQKEDSQIEKWQQKSKRDGL